MNNILTLSDGSVLAEENNELFLKGFFDINSKLFEALCRFGEYRDYSDTIYQYDIDLEDGQMEEGAPYYGKFLFWFKGMTKTEFLDRFGFTVLH